jgi:hypothetical protein
MAEVRFGEFHGETIVVHFGGESASINVYTLTRSLAGFADTARAISAIVDPGQEIEILVEANGPGSFRTVVRRLRKDYGGMFSGAVQAVFWGVVGNVIYDKYVKHESAPQVIVTTDEVVIKIGDQQVIVPRQVHDAAENAKKDPEVDRCIRRTFEPLQKDLKVTGFGLTTGLDAPKVPLYIPRTDFPRFTHDLVLPEETLTQRTNTATARLVILKAWLNQAKRKWSFEWNGVPISAPIKDNDFLDAIAKREYLIGAGDALDVEISFKQTFDKQLKVYVTDPSSYVVTKVLAHVSKETPGL